MGLLSSVESVYIVVDIGRSCDDFIISYEEGYCEHKGCNEVSNRLLTLRRFPVCKPLIVPPLLPQEVLKQLQSKLEQEAGTLASSGRSDVLHQLKGPNPSENRRLTFKSSRSVVLMEIRFSL